MTDAILAAASHLSALLARENASLRATDLSAAVGIVAQKRSATEVLARALASGPAALPEATLAVLRDLRTLANENQTLLERMIAVQRQIIEVIRGAIPKATSAPRYGASGSLAASRTVTAYALVSRA